MYLKYRRRCEVGMVLSRRRSGESFRQMVSCRLGIVTLTKGTCHGEQSSNRASKHTSLQTRPKRHFHTQVYQVGSGLSPKSFQDPTSRRLYATGSCSVCVLTSLQKRSKPYFLPVAREPKTSKMPLVTARLVSVLTTLPLATSAASSPRRSAVMLLRPAEAGVLPFAISERGVEPCWPPSR